MVGVLDADDWEPAEILGRCALTVNRLLQGQGEAGDLDAAVADLHRLPEDLSERGGLAAGLVLAIFQTGERGGPRDLRHLDDLLTIADRNPPPLPEWPRVRAVARAMATMHAGLAGRPTDPRAALRELDALEDSDPRAQTQVRLLRATVSTLAAAQEGDGAGLRRALDDLQQLRRSVDDPELGQLLDALVVGHNAITVTTQQSEVPDMLQAYDQLKEVTERLGPGHRQVSEALSGAEPVVEMFRRALGAGDGSAEPLTEEELAAARAFLERSRASGMPHLPPHLMTGAMSLISGSANDPARVDEAVSDFRRVVAQAAPDDPQRVFYLVTLGVGLVRRLELTGRVDGLDEAARALTEARMLAGGPEHQLWSLVNGCLAVVNRRLGETSGSRRVAIEGLRRYAWSALFQADPAAAAAAVRDAATEAVQIAGECLVDNEPADAIQALDAGRGLLLFAATEFRNLTTRLDAAGRRDLSHRWRLATAAGDLAAVPPELRREVLAVLSAPAGGLPSRLDPPTLPEIRSALLALDADALVYLVPGTVPGPGWAVIAPAQGPPGFIPLPNLQLDDEVDVERYLAALSQRDAVLAETRSGDPDREVAVQAAETRFQGSLNVLCDWAWRAAVGPLLERYVARLPARPAGRPPRVVLVPVGALARVPWQAARRPDGRYAVELAAFSQVVSARTLCDSAALSPVPLAPLGLVVGDPDTGGEAADLVAARLEAYAIHQAFYRGARYVGRRPDGSTSRSGPGSGDDVRDWLTSTRPAAGAMLHLACHGVIQADPTDTSSYLLLAGRDRLTAEELTGLLAGAGDRAVALVVLAACRTGVSGRGYDEAYSLGTAFLAAGVRSALSTQWRIPDRATSVLMYMFHHFLMVQRRPVWEALRQAQLWMLDPRREYPKGMPPPLRRQLPGTGPAPVVAWAGFTHWGQ